MVAEMWDLESWLMRPQGLQRGSRKVPEGSVSVYLWKASYVFRKSGGSERLLFVNPEILSPKTSSKYLGPENDTLSGIYSAISSQTGSRNGATVEFSWISGGG